MSSTIVWSSSCRIMLFPFRHDLLFINRNTERFVLLGAIVRGIYFQWLFYNRDFIALIMTSLEWPTHLSLIIMKQVTAFADFIEKVWDFVIPSFWVQSHRWHLGTCTELLGLMTVSWIHAMEVLLFFRPFVNNITLILMQRTMVHLYFKGLPRMQLINWDDVNLLWAVW